MSDQKNLFIGIKGHVVCIQKSDGNERWRTKLRSSDITSVMVTDDAIIATTGGYLYALNPISGNVLWENPLKGLGMGVSTLSVD